jgi:integrase
MDKQKFIQRYAIRSPVTREYYLCRLRRFFDFLGLEEGCNLEDRCNYFAKLGKNDPSWAFLNILRYVESEKNRVEKKQIIGGTLRNSIKTIKMFCETSDLSIPWKKISRGLPRGRRYADDRAPTIEEIRRILEYPDRRIKPIVLTVSSCGFRLGSWDYLKWRNVHPIIRGNQLVAAKLVVYGGDDDEYFSFVTPEAYHSLNDWMTKDRKRSFDLD